MTHDLSVRKAVAADADTIFCFVASLIEDHFPGQAPWTSAAQIRSDGFGDDPLFEAFLAEQAGKPVGMVSYFRGYAGMRGKPMGIVHAIYVAPSARRSGVAQALMAAVAHVAVVRGWCRLELFVEEGLPALAFYDAIGMIDLGHRHLRLEGSRLETMAKAGHQLLEG